MTTDEVRAKVDGIVQRLKDDDAFRSQMGSDPAVTLMGAGLGEEAAVILAEDWQGANPVVERPCLVNNSCRFSDSVDPCGPTATSLRVC